MVSTIEKKPSCGKEIGVCRSRQGREAHTFLMNVEREMALNRLLNLLEADAGANTVRAGRARRNPASRIARLRSAHATYALATSTGMQRVSPGAWINRRHAEQPEEDI